MTGMRLDVLAAGHGDALVITYGRADRPARILIDGGPARSYEDGLRRYIRDLPEDQRHFELLVVTHIDADHIDGAILLMRDRQRLGVTFGEVWFNDWDRIERTRGAKQGELLGRLLKEQRTTAGEGPTHDGHDVPLAGSESGAGPEFGVNSAFGGDQPVVQQIDDRVVLPGGAELIVVSPRPVELGKLARKWEAVLKESGFTPGTADSVNSRMDAKYSPREDREGREVSRGASGQLDTGLANGSSIAFLLSFAGQRLLLAGDAYAPVLHESIGRLCDRFGVDRLKVNTFKLPHHGSASNLTEGLLSVLDCECFVVSTDGKYFDHPDEKAIELIASMAPPQRPPRIVFNYDVDTTKGYRDDPRIVAEYGSHGHAVVEIGSSI